MLFNAAREGGAKHTLLDLLFSGTWNEEYDVDNCTSLWMAAKKGDLEVVNALIQAAKAAGGVSDLRDALWPEQTARRAANV